MFRIKILLITSLSFLATLVGCSGILDSDEPGNLVPETVADDPSLPSIEVNGAIFHAEAFGDIHNPIIVFLHGGPGSDYRAFISQINVENASRYPDRRTITNGGLSQLQDEYYCVFYDQRGAGLSQRFDKGEVTFNLYIEDLHSIIDHYLDKKQTQTGVVDAQVYLLGWSFGGILATGYINKYPERVKDVIMYEPGPFTRNAWDYLIENSESPFLQLNEDWMDEYLLSNDHITSDTHERADYQKMLGAFRGQPELNQNPNTPMWRLGSFIDGENLDFMESDNYDITSKIAASFHGRLLLISGRLTEEPYPEYSAMQMACYTNSEYKAITGVGHTGVWEKPDEIAGAVRDFLNNN